MSVFRERAKNFVRFIRLHFQIQALKTEKQNRTQKPIFNIITPAPRFNGYYWKEENKPSWLFTLCGLYGHVFYLKTVYCMRSTLNEHFLEEREIITRISGWIQRPMFWPHKGEARAFNSTPTFCNQLLFKLNSLVKFYRKVLNLWCERHMVVVSLGNRKFKLKKKPRKRLQKTPLPPSISLHGERLNGRNNIQLVWFCSEGPLRSASSAASVYKWESWDQGGQMTLCAPPSPLGQRWAWEPGFLISGSLYCASLILGWL